MPWEGDAAAAAGSVSAAMPAAPHPPPPATHGVPPPLYSPPKRARSAAAVPAAPAAAAAAPLPTVLRTSLRNFRIVATSPEKADAAVDNADTRVRYVVKGCFDGKSFAFRTEPAVASEQKRRGLRRRRRQDSSETSSETQSESSGWSSESSASSSSARCASGAHTRHTTAAAEATEAVFDDELRILYEVDDATTLPLRTLKVDVLVETERVGAVSGGRRRGRRRGGDRQEVFSSTRLLQSFERDLGEVLRSGPAQRTRPFRLRDDDGGSGGQRHVLRFDCSMAEEQDVFFELRGLTLRVDSEHCRRIGLLPSSPLYLSAVDTSGGSSDVVATAAALPSPSHEFCTVAFPAAPPAGLTLMNATFGELAVQEHAPGRAKGAATGGEGSDVGRSILFRLMCCGPEQLPGGSGARETASGHRELLSFTVPTAALLRKARFAAVGGGVPLSPRCEVSSARSCHAPFSVVAPVAEATGVGRSARRAACVELRGVVACDTLPLRADCAARPSSQVERQGEGIKGRQRRRQQRAAGSRRTRSDRGGGRRRRSSLSDADRSQSTEGENEEYESERSFAFSAEASPRHHHRNHSRHRRHHHRRRHSSREGSPTREERARRRERSGKRRSRRRRVSPTSSPPPPPPVADYHRHRPPRHAAEGPFDPPPPPQPPLAPPVALGGSSGSGGGVAAATAVSGGLRPDASWGSSFQLHGGHATAPPVPLYTLEEEARAAAASGHGHGHGGFKGGHGWAADNVPCDAGAGGTTPHSSQNASLNSVVRRRIHDLNLRLHEVRRRSASFADVDAANAQQRAHVSPRRAAEAAVPTGSSRHESPLRQRRRSPPRSDGRATGPDAPAWGPAGPSAGRRIRDARAEAEAAGGAALPLTKLELLQRENDRLHEELTGSNVRRVRSGPGAGRRREVSPERQRRSVPVPADAVRTADMVGVLAETTTDQEYRLKKLEGEITSLLKRAETAEISRAAAEISMTCMREATAAAPATDGAKRMSPRRHHHHHPARGSSSGGVATPVRPPSSPHASSPRGVGASVPQPPPPAARFSAGGRGPPLAAGSEAVGFGGAADTVVQVEGAAVCIGVAGVDYVGGDVPELLKACALGRSADVVFVDSVYQAAAAKGVRVESRFFTPLHAACRWNADPAMLRMLLSHGEDVNSISREGDTPLHLLALCPTVSVECLSVLLQAGANVAAYNARGLAPLHLAALNPCDRGQRFLRFLIYQGGADINQRSQDGVSALLLCEGDHAVCAFLKEGGAT